MVSRLVIRELELENFKSYAGIQKVGPFHKSFSSVVGPNGSGKSNVIDAMLFVFGKRAKQLRLNKVSELIHTSTNHSDIDSARVSVYFQEIIDKDTAGDDFEIIEGSELVVTRTAHMNNTSKYYVNHKASNFTEVTNLLREKGIDLDHNRFLILQGEVEQISMMKPKAGTPHEEGLLEYLEDIIGTNKYIEKIEELGKALEEVTEQRDSHVQRLKHVEKEREGLEGARKEAEAFMAKEAELWGWQSILYRLYVKQAKANLQQIHLSKDQLELRLKEEKEKQFESDAALQKIKTEYESGVKAFESVQAELDRTGNEFKDFERRDVKFREDMKHLKNKLKKAIEKTLKEEKKRESASKEAENLKEELPLLELKISEAEKSLEPVSKRLLALEEGIQSEVNVYRLDLEKVQSELVPWEKSIAEAKTKADLIQSEKQTLIEKHQTATDALESVIRSLELANETHKVKSDEYSTMETTLIGKKAELDTMLIEESKLKEDCKQLMQSSRSTKARMQELKAAKDVVKSKNQILQTLMMAKKSGNIKGIWGRLGDLGFVDKKYDVAASTASGALDYIVVSDTEAAQKCVKLLREKNVGVATFLILEKQQHLLTLSQQKLEPPTGSQRLFDLVTASHQELSPAFYYAFRNTIVTTDLDQASRIAYGNDKRWKRVVTLDGKLIESSGTMSGGGGKPKGGKICVGSMASLQKCWNDDVDSGCDDDQISLEKIQARLKDGQQLLKDVQSNIKSLNDTISKTELCLRKLEAEVLSCKENSEVLKSQMKNLETKAIMSENDSDRLKALDDALITANGELERVRSDSATLHEKAEMLRNKISEAGGEPMKKTREEVSRIKETIENLNTEIPQTKVKINAQEKISTKAEKACQASKSEEERLQTEVKSLKESFKDIEKQAAVVMEKYEEAQALQSKKSVELKILTDQYDRMKEEVSLIRTTGVDIEAKLEDCARSLNEEGINEKHWSDELDRCRSQLAERGDDTLSVTDEEIASYTIDDAKYKVTMSEAELEKMRPDMGAIEAYNKKDKEYADRLACLEEISGSRDECRGKYESLRRRRLDDFMVGFNVISMKLKEMYQMITLGGDAELELVDSLDPFSEGIVFSVRPPKKSWKNICNLSGGEKTLSSLALVFALHHFKPTPLYVMDEIDAALDFKNVSIVAHYIKERTKDAQFVIISLRNNMFELADRLVGIYKTDNCTKSVTINPGSFTVGGRELTV